MFFLFLSFFLIFLLPATDPDLGWHLRCGQEFWQNHSFCAQNQFSVLLPNYFWPNHYWLYQTIIYPLYQIFGLWGLTILNATLMTTTLFFFYKSVRQNIFFIFYLLLFILISWGVFSFGIRSQEMSFFFFSFLLFLASKFRQNYAMALFCPLILLLWANFHGGSVILGLILIVFLISQTKQIRLIGLISLISFLVTFLNPFGFAIYQDAWQHFAGADLSKLIAEWVPPAPVYGWLIIFSLGVFLLSIFHSPTSRGFFSLVFLSAFAFLALKARRHLPFYWLFWSYLFLKSETPNFLFSFFLRRKPDFITFIKFINIIIYKCFYSISNKVIKR